MHDLGFHYRITDLQCALGSSQLRRLDRFVARRRELAARYDRRLRALEDAGHLSLPRDVNGAESSRHLYPVRIPGRRDEVYLRLRASGIHTQVHYTPVHLQPFYRENFGTTPGQCPTAEGYFEDALSLPLFPAMGDADVDRVAEALETIL
jgi:dTDP-4-amino-4,6-dideoxygalactose transaminase